MSVLSVNVGSSSVKFALYALDGQHRPAARLLAGEIGGLASGRRPSFTSSGEWSDRLTLSDLSEGMGIGAAIGLLADALRSLPGLPPLHAIAHRVVHGGERYAQAVQLDEDVLMYLQGLLSLAPLHQPFNLEGMRIFRRLWPDIPQVACFDTAFHASQPLLSRRLPIPQALHDQGIHRYGFHGLSYQFIAERLAEKSERANGRVMMAHLGNGSSVCGMKAGHSHCSSMGFSALDGLMMGTRSGSIDPGVILYLMQQGWGAQRIEDLLYRQSGLLGVSGISADIRQLRADGSAQAMLAIDLYLDRLIREFGATMAALGGIDIIAFSGGIGEHDADIRQRACDALAWTGVCIDRAANLEATGADALAIHRADSVCEIHVVPTDEGLVAARQATFCLWGKTGSSSGTDS